MASTSVIILIDNTAHSIDADFPPNRFDAQKICIEQLADHYSRKGPNAEVGVGTISSIDSGIKVSLTTRQELIKITKGLTQVKCGGKAKLYSSIRRAVLALNCCAPENKLDRRIIAFIGSPHDVTNENSVSLSDYLNRAGVSLVIISFSDLVDNAPLQLLVDSLKDEKSKLIKIGSDSPTLYNAVYTSLIKAEDTTDMIPQDDDPELAQAIRMSLEAQNPQLEDDPELAAAIKASLQNYGNNDNNQIAEDDPELAAAIALSLKENNITPHQEEEKQDKMQTPEATKTTETAKSQKKTDSGNQAQK